MTARTAFAGLAAAAFLVAPARAAAPPVGPLQPGPTMQITTNRGELVAVALPAQPSGRVWRLKGRIDVRVVRQVSEADVGKDVVILFRATGRGTTTLSYGSTRGETPKAYAAKRFHIAVR
jgi:hypothetical protein